MEGNKFYLLALVSAFFLGFMLRTDTDADTRDRHVPGALRMGNSMICAGFVGLRLAFILAATVSA